MCPQCTPCQFDAEAWHPDAHIRGLKDGCCHCGTVLGQYRRIFYVAQTVIFWTGRRNPQPRAGRGCCHVDRIKSLEGARRSSLSVINAPPETSFGFGRAERKSPGTAEAQGPCSGLEVAQTITMLIQCGSGAIEPGGVDLKVQASDLMGAEAVAAIV
jgi:hypothetical protein